MRCAEAANRSAQTLSRAVGARWNLLQDATPPGNVSMSIRACARMGTCTCAWRGHRERRHACSTHSPARQSRPRLQLGTEYARRPRRGGRRRPPHRRPNSERGLTRPDQSLVGLSTVHGARRRSDATSRLRSGSLTFTSSDCRTSVNRSEPRACRQFAPVPTRIDGASPALDAEGRTGIFC